MFGTGTFFYKIVRHIKENYTTTREYYYTCRYFLLFCGVLRIKHHVLCIVKCDYMGFGLLIGFTELFSFRLH
jgi:hypothetical protein